MHYTITLWESADAMKTFARSGAHLTAMKRSSSIAQEIRTLVTEVDSMPTWREAKERLQKDAKVLSF